MVETPTAAITVSPSAEFTPLKDAKEEELESGPTITLVHQKPITSSIRGTIKHLVSQAGRLARWRGIKILFLYQFCVAIVAHVFKSVIPHIPGRMAIVAALSGAALANLHATWTHKVISMPTNKRFMERLVPRSNWKLLAFPAAVEASATYIAVYLIHGYCFLVGLDQVNNEDFAKYDGNDWLSLVMKIISVIGISVATVLFIIIPALVTLIRVEASILPEDEDTVVPFDRTFGGKVVPKILGGTGCVSFLDAWRSFKWEARWRLIKLYIKCFFIFIAIYIAMAHVLAFETWAILGPQLGEALSQARH
jgi:hypothetical protein